MLDREPGASEDVVRAAVEASRVPLPEDYLDFCRESNGAEGWVGEGYLQLWPLDELAGLNAAAAVEELVPGLVLIGGDGGGEGYGVVRDGDGAVTYVRVPLVGMAPGEVEVLGVSFAEFLGAVAGGARGSGR